MTSPCIFSVEAMADSTSPSVKKRRKLKMEDILEDENLFNAFYSYSRRNLMSEAIDLWNAVESMCYNLPTEEEKVAKYKEIAADHFLRGCRFPVNMNHDLLERLRGLYMDLQYEDTQTLPPVLILDLRRELWLLMTSSCLPAFLDSDVYENFLNGIMYTSKEEFSIQKAEQFFGYRVNPFEITLSPVEDAAVDVPKKRKGKRNPKSPRTPSFLSPKNSTLSPAARAVSPPLSPPLPLPPPRAKSRIERENVPDFSFLTDYPEEEGKREAEDEFVGVMML